jgi:hypothetical protein
MPNMGRTLLLNMSGENRPAQPFYGEEYVPPYFRPVDIPSGLIAVRRALFGTDPDTEGLNYSIWQYMRMLHSTEYGAYVTDLDDRITYLGDRSLLDFTYGPTVEPAGALQFVGNPGLGAANGRLRAAWNVRISGTSVTVSCMTTPREQTSTVTISGGLTSFVPLVPYTDYKVRIDTNLGETAWTVSYLSHPGIAMNLVSRAEGVTKIGAVAYETLFPRRDPYTLFRELWEQHSQLPYKLSGVVLALIYRTNEYRT